MRTCKSTVFPQDLWMLQAHVSRSPLFQVHQHLIPTERKASSLVLSLDEIKFRTFLLFVLRFILDGHNLLSADSEPVFYTVRAVEA